MSSRKLRAGDEKRKQKSSKVTRSKSHVMTLMSFLEIFYSKRTLVKSTTATTAEPRQETNEIQAKKELQLVIIET